MANIKSAKKRIKVTEFKTLKNKMVKSALKTTLKKFETSLLTDNKDEIQASFKSAVRALDMAASKGIIHKNTAARKKSRLSVKISSKLSA